MFSASSLTDVFHELEQSFERARPDVDIVLSFAGSQTLRLQIEQGADAAVFASANAAHMNALQNLGLIVDSDRFAYNHLVVIVPADNPAELATFRDLPRARSVVIGAENVPVGVYTRALLKKSAAHYGPAFVDEVLANVVSEERNVRLVRAKVELGEADAAIVYRSDAITSQEVGIIDIPEELDVRTEYHIGVVSRSASTALARAWVEHLRTPESRAIFARHGFDVAR
ncbi:MAG: molybdate ABC transporter substrate-binding protein [Haliangiales bacterium]